MGAVFASFSGETDFLGIFLKKMDFTPHYSLRTTVYPLANSFEIFVMI